MCVKRPHDQIGQRIALYVVPTCAGQRVRRKLHVRVHATILCPRLDVRLLRDATILRIIVRTLEIVERRGDRKRLEPRGMVEGKRDLGNDSARANAAQRSDKFRFQPAWLDQTQKRTPRIRAGEYERRWNLFAASKGNARNASVAHLDT